MELIDVVNKLIGPIEPVGSTEIDCERYENLKTMINLVDKLIVDIRNVSFNTNRQEHSMLKAGKCASAFLNQIATECQPEQSE